jgi:uncharacterized protein (DUF488 family)
MMKMARPRQFEEDIDFLFEKLTRDDDIQVRAKLKYVKERLIDLNKRNLVKINHSVMEFLCAKELIARGYNATVEHTLNNLTCDVFGVKNDGNIIIEIETGFVFPDHALDPLTYNNVRVASKIARYSSFANKFSLATMPNNILNIPQLFIKPPRYRKDEEMAEMKIFFDKYYKNPPIGIEEIRQARLHTIYIISVDDGKVWETDPEAYINYTSQQPFSLAKNNMLKKSEYVTKLSR